LSEPVAILTLGCNYMGYTGDVNMRPGEALDCQDVLPRYNGALMSYWGWLRRNATANANPFIWHKGFTYKGKNSGAHDVRPGNHGIADTGALFTRRAAFYCGALFLTDAGAWNLYLAGWADENLRWDPVDERFYVIGWPSTPDMPTGATINNGASTNIIGASYRYRISWVDLYTGEQSGLGDEYEHIPAAGAEDYNFSAVLPAYPAAADHNRRWHRGFSGAPEDSDVGIAVYRTEPDQGQLNFLGLVYPYDAGVPWSGLAAATEFSDGTALRDGSVGNLALATDASRPEFVRNYFDPPLLDAWVYHKKMWYGLAWEEEARDVSAYATGKQVANVRSTNRVYHNDFSGMKSQLERWLPLNFKEIDTGEGDVLTCLAKSKENITVLSSETAYMLDPEPNFETGEMEAKPTPLDWTVGCVGPRAYEYVDGYIYWLSRRGPYRARPGGEPEFIGKLVSPMFFDPESGLCKLNPAAALRSQVAYDDTTKMVRFIFPAGVSILMNRHLGYWTEGPQQHGGDIYHGWFRFSTRAQWLDYTHALGRIDPETSAPENQWVRDARLVFSDNLGYMYESEPGIQRGGPDAGQIVEGICANTSTTTQIDFTADGLYDTGDGLTGMRLEVVYSDGTIDIRTVASNTGVAIVPDVALSQAPDSGSDRFYVAGVPAYWLSWVDHVGDPQAHKDLTHLYVSFNRQTTDPNTVIDMTVAAAEDFPGTFDQRLEVNVDRNTQKLLVGIVGRFFQYEMACSRPDQRFCLTSIERAPKLLERRNR
jgi:hypothetical protein